MSAPRELMIDAAGISTRAWLAGESQPGNPVLLLHGFTGAVESMQEVGRALAAARPVVALDLVGHGHAACPADPGAYAMDACVTQVAAALERLGIPRAHLLGYSMGGRVALSLALACPERVACLVLVGASPGLAEPDARAARIASDEELAQRIERDGLERFVDTWMALPLFASQAKRGASLLAASRAQRLASKPAGLAASLRGMGTGSMPPLHDRLALIEAPVCFVAGSLDAKFVALARSMGEKLPGAELALVEGAGHAAHLEDPERFTRIARAFLDRHDEDPAEAGVPQEPQQEIRA